MDNPNKQELEQDNGPVPKGRPFKADEELKRPRKLYDKKNIPVRIASVLYQMQDNRGLVGKFISRAQLDDLEETKLLQTAEKDLIAKYWPRWTEELSQVNAIALLRKESLEIVTKTERVAKHIALQEDFENLDDLGRAKAIAALASKNYEEASLFFAAMKPGLMSAKQEMEHYRWKNEVLKNAWVALEQAEKRVAALQKLADAIAAQEPEEDSQIVLDAIATLEGRGKRLSG